MKKILIGFGLLWLFIWSTFGIFLRTQWHFYKHQIGIIATEGVLRDYSEIQTMWKHNETVWMHGVLSSMLVIMVGLILLHSQVSNTQMKIMGILLIMGTILTTLFHLIGVLSIMILGDILVIIAVFITLGGLVNNRIKGRK